MAFEDWNEQKNASLEFPTIPIEQIDCIMEYDGFIGLGGEFYPVREKKKLEPIHDHWANRYLMRYYKIKKYNPSYYLVSKIGFILVTSYKGKTSFFGEIRNEEQQKTMSLIEDYDKRKEKPNEKNLYKRLRTIFGKRN